MDLRADLVITGGTDHLVAVHTATNDFAPAPSAISEIADSCPAPRQLRTPCHRLHGSRRRPFTGGSGIISRARVMPVG